MPIETLKAFTDEIAALQYSIVSQPNRTVRDEELRDRSRTLYRTWLTIVAPQIRPHLRDGASFFKLEGELEAIAGLTRKFKPKANYSRRLIRVLSFLERLAIFMPPTKVVANQTRSRRDDLFLPAIPDLPFRLVPNPLIGWRGRIEEFTMKHKFDKSIFIMIRYRPRNESLIKQVKAALKSNGYEGIVAKDHQITDDLYNPIACLLCCSRGLAIFDAPETGQEFNPNVAYELGMMHMLGRDCRILKHQQLKVLHTDILMKLYVSYKGFSSAAGALQDWLGIT